MRDEIQKKTIITEKPKVREKVFKSGNYINSEKEKKFLLPLIDINKKIFEKINKNFLKSNSLSSRDKKIILKVIESYEHLREKNFLKNDQFVLSDHEIHEFLKLEENNILRYILSYADGKNNLLDISNKSGFKLNELQTVLNICLKKKLIKY